MKELIVIGLAGISLGGHPLLIKWLNVRSNNQTNGLLLFFVVELVKMAVSLGLFIREEYKTLSWRRPPQVHFVFLAFATGYAITNNLTVLITQSMDPALYQVLVNLKVLTTAIAYSLLLRKPQTSSQWLALALLTVGAGVTQLDDFLLGDKAAAVPGATWIGLLLTLLQTSMSGLLTAGSERFVKGRMSESMYWQNTELYAFGVLVNFASSTVGGGSGGLGSLWRRGLLHGLLGADDPSSLDVLILVLTVLNASFGGMLVGIMLKMFSSITKAYTASFSTVFATLLSYTVLSQKLPSPLFLTGACTVCVSTVIYFRVTAAPQPSTTPHESKAK